MMVEERVKKDVMEWQVDVSALRVDKNQVAFGGIARGALTFSVKRLVSRLKWIAFWISRPWSRVTNTRPANSLAHCQAIPFHMPAKASRVSRVDASSSGFTSTTSKPRSL